MKKKKSKRTCRELDLVAQDAKVKMLDYVTKQGLVDCEYDYVMLEIARQIISSQVSFAADIVNR